MISVVKHFRDISEDLMPLSGGKGGMLAKMYRANYPVPEGFVVMPSAFCGVKLQQEARSQVGTQLAAIRSINKNALFAVRSSALSEDSAQASFAGEFETILNVQSDDEVVAAIYQVYSSRQSERVKAYTAAHGMDQTHQMAVVVQLMVPSEVAGVVFTADPVTGSSANMIGNFVYGLGEQLVSGEADAYSFKLIRPKGKYEGHEACKKYAPQFFKLASRLEKELGVPLDIEWAVAHGKLYLLQARPITTLSAGNLDRKSVV